MRRFFYYRTCLIFYVLYNCAELRLTNKKGKMRQKNFDLTGRRILPLTMFGGERGSVLHSEPAL